MLEKTHLRRPNITLSHPSQPVVHKIKICRNYCIFHTFVFKGRKFRLLIVLSAIKTVVLHNRWEDLNFVDFQRQHICNHHSLVVIRQAFYLRVSDIPLFFPKAHGQIFCDTDLKVELLLIMLLYFCYLIHCQFLSVSLIYTKIKAIVWWVYITYIYFVHRIQTGCNICENK